MPRRAALLALPATLVLLASGCGDDGGSDGSDGSDGAGGEGVSTLEQDAQALVDCLSAGGVDAAVNDAVPLGVEAETVGVEASDLPSSTLKFDTGSGTLNAVSLWVFATPEEATEARPFIALADEDDDRQWVSGRVVVDWGYPVDTAAPEAVTVQDCVDETAGS